jgi:K+-sensing histidine kinase KdpD
MDLAAVLARLSQVALVDELAHTNAPGSPNEKRWQDIEELLDAGITVITTVNVQHLESLNDVVYEITGVRQRETMPDAVVRQAQQIELVDMTPEALRRRLAHGNVYTPDKIDAVLGNYFRVGNLTALRELALLWVAGKVDEQLDKYRADPCVGSPICLAPGDGDAEVHVDETYTLVLAGHPLAAQDRRVLEAFAAQATVALRQERLEEAAATAGSLAEVDRLRTALLSAVSHDLRTPLASAKAAVGTLRMSDLPLSEEDQSELLVTAEESLDRPLAMQPIDVADVISSAVTSLGQVGAGAIIRVPEDTPEVQADPALLERAIANLVQTLYATAHPATLRRSPPVRTARLSRSGSSTAARRTRNRLGPDLPAIPTARGSRQHQRRRPRSRLVARARRSHVRNFDPGRHTRRRPDYDDLIARRGSNQPRR